NPTLERNGWTSPHTVVQMVNDDMPFLVDSSTMTLDALGHGLRLTIHPLFAVERDGRGKLKSIGPPDGTNGKARIESFIHIEIARQTDPAVLERIETELRRTLADVRAAVEDWKPMLERLAAARQELAESRGAPDALRDEACAFLDWLAADHFTLLGYREYELRRGKDFDTLHPVPSTGLGILRQDERVPEAARLAGAAREEARSPHPLVITKTNARSRVHRPVPLDYVSVKVFDSRGEPCAERRFLGLFTSSAYNELPRDIPLLRLKVQQLIELSGVDPKSHRGKTLQQSMETLPPDALCQASIRRATAARRCSTSSIRSRATISSRRRSRISRGSRTASSRCRSEGACGSSRAGIRSAGSIAASCTCRGISTRAARATASR